MSLVGSEVSLLVVPLVALRLLRATTLQVALLTMLERLPFLLVGLPAGALVDRVRRRPMLITADIGRAAMLASVPVASWLGLLSLAQLYVVVLAAGTPTVFFDVAYPSYLPALVGRDRLVDANVLIETSRSGAEIAGPAAGGVLYGLLRAGAVGIDALSFVWSAAMVWSIRSVEPESAADPPSDGSRARRLASEFAGGVQYVWHHEWLRAIALCSASSNFFYTMLLAIYVTYATRVLHLGPTAIGVVGALGSVGYLIGASTVRPAIRRFGIGPTVVGGACLLGPAAASIAAAPAAAPFGWLVSGWLVASLGGPHTTLHRSASAS